MQTNALLARIQKHSLTAQRYNDLMTSPLQVHSHHQTKQLHNTPDYEIINNVKQKKQPQEQEQPRKQMQTQKNWYTISANDQLFWCMLMIARSWDEDDLPEQRNRFEIEKKEKLELTEKLQKTEKVIWREMKLTRTGICNKMAEAIYGKIGMDEMRAIAFLYEKNIIYIWGNCCVVMNGARGVCGASVSANANANATQWHVIIRKREGYFLATDEYAKEMKKNVDDGEYYVVEDPNKPLMSLASYKLSDLDLIADKLKINVNREDGKHKLKKDIYDEISRVINKI